MKILSFALVSCLTGSLFAGSTIESKDGKYNLPVETKAKSKVELSFSAGGDYVFSSDFDNSKLGDQDAWHEFATFGVAIPMTDSIYLSLGGFYDRFDFGTSLAPVPTTLQRLGANIGIQYRVDGVTGIEISAQPGFYGSEINGNSFNVPLLAYGLYKLTPDFVLVGGVRYDQWSEYSIMPLVGFVWTINDQWRIKATLPDPQIEYTVNPDLVLSVGGEVTGGTYRTAKSEHNFSNENLDYSDYRGTVGVRYSGWKPLDLQVRAGWSVEREFRYDRGDNEFRTGGAPFVSVSAGAKF